MFLTVMSAIGLFFLRIAIARPVVRRVEGISLRSISVAFVVASVLGLLAIPVYLERRLRSTRCARSWTSARSCRSSA